MPDGTAITALVPLPHRPPTRREAVARETTGPTQGVKQAAKSAGISADLGTHSGRRTVVTTLFVDGDEALEDIARFVGPARPATTAGYVKRFGRRPESVARRAAAILDGDQGDDDGTTPGGVRNHPGEVGSNGGSNRSASLDEALPDPGP
jgi:hypothetical protein